MICCDIVGSDIIQSKKRMMTSEKSSHLVIHSKSTSEWPRDTGEHDLLDEVINADLLERLAHKDRLEDGDDAVAKVRDINPWMLQQTPSFMLFVFLCWGYWVRDRGESTFKSSEAEGRLVGSISKHFFKKSLPCSEIFSGMR